MVLALPAAAPDEPRAFLRENTADGRGVLLLAEVDAVPVGFAQVYPTRSSLSLGDSWVLNDLFVDPGARGTGVGRALVREVYRRAAEAGATFVTLKTARDTARAQALYDSEGFHPEHTYLYYEKAVS